MKTLARVPTRLRLCVNAWGHMQIGTSRAQTGMGRMQTGTGRMYTLAGRTQTAPKTQEILDGHISLKTCQNRAFEVFFGIYKKFRCQKTPQTLDLDKF